MGIVPALLIVLGVWSSRSTAHAEPRALDQSPERASPAARAAGSSACERLLAESPPGAFDSDPHTFRCVVCHDTRTGEFPKPAAATCASLACHARAWTETPLHNLEPSKFSNCTSCHLPHVWKPASRLCVSCHEDVRGPAGEVAAPAVPGAGAFSHAGHTEFGCGACHAAEGVHGAVTLRSASDCASCHHEREAGRGCAACHGGARLPAPFEVALSMRFAEGAAPRARSLAFDHRRHAELACSRCHASAESAVLPAACLDCHAGHADAQALCVSCHDAPPAGVHALDVHERGCGGAGCHATPAVLTMPLERNVCLSCHRDEADHMPGRDCAGCHLVTRTGGGER